MDNIQNSKRIAKNTLLLYLRMVVVTIVSLYTARLTLILLGIENLGIFNVVAGLVTFTEIITATMTSATQRFLSYDLGANKGKDFGKTFSMLINVFFIIAFLLVTILELIGPYVVSNYLVIPYNRLYAAQIVFQISILSMIFSIMAIPYNSVLVACEKMGMYAYFTFVDVVIKLMAVLSLYIIPYDRLITYGTISSVSKIIVFILLFIYCRRSISECRYSYVWDRKLLKRISSYSGWSLLGSTNWVFMNQGQAILLNLYFGPVINGAKAVADKIRNIVFLLSTNFYLAVSPQIIKSYASGEIDYLKSLLYNSTRYGYYILLFVCLPLFNNMYLILSLWLGENQVSDEMVLFSKWILIYSLVSVIEPPLTKIVQATGNVKKYEIFVGIITLSYLPICAFFLSFGIRPFYSVVILTVVYGSSYIYRIWHVNKILDTGMFEYCKKTLFEMFVVTAVAVLLNVIAYLFIGDIGANLLFRMSLSLIITTSVICCIGLKINERSFILNHLKKHLLNL